MDLEQAMLDPSRVFAEPAAVCEAPTLTRAQKIEILRRWEYDARELQVAADENMGNDPGNLLTEVLGALHQLGATGNPDQSAPTKQGGE